MIKKDELKHGHYYQGHCRNASIARWDAVRQFFLYRRHKFGDTFLEEICHPDDEKVYDVFLAKRDLTEAHETVTYIPLD